MYAIRHRYRRTRRSLLLRTALISDEAASCCRHHVQCRGRTLGAESGRSARSAGPGRAAGIIGGLAGLASLVVVTLISTWVLPGD